MNHILSRLILYSDLGHDSILRRLADLFRDWERQRSQERGFTSRSSAFWTWPRTAALMRTSGSAISPGC